jgi:hypothetical protein
LSKLALVANLQFISYCWNQMKYLLEEHLQ